MVAIRDDDTSYYTSPNDLLNIYEKFLVNGHKLSLAVIPYGYKMYFPGNRNKFYLGNKRHYIYDNCELVDFLKTYIRKNQIEIMQHGYDHSYYVNLDGKIRLLNKEAREKIGLASVGLLPECIIKDSTLFRKQLLTGREILEDTFKTKIVTFVPPSNAINSELANIVDFYGLNMSATITDKFNRKFDKYSTNIYFKKVIWKIVGNKYSYPYVMNYKNHKELIGFSFTPQTNIEWYYKAYCRTKKIGCNFTVATHYWELCENKNLSGEFKDFVKYICSNDEITCLRDLF